MEIFFVIIKSYTTLILKVKDNLRLNSHLILCFFLFLSCKWAVEIRKVNLVIINDGIDGDMTALAAPLVTALAAGHSQTALAAPKVIERTTEEIL